MSSRSTTVIPVRAPRGEPRARDHGLRRAGVVVALLQTEVTYSPSGRVKGIDGPLKVLKGYGAKFVQKNRQLLQMPFEAAKTLPP